MLRRASELWSRPSPQKAGTPSAAPGVRPGAAPGPAAVQTSVQACAEPLPLYKGLMTQAQSLRRVVILDCAPATSSSVSAFGPLRCRIEYLNLPALFPYLSRTEDGHRLRQIIASVLPPRAAGAPITHILCWDYLNYLSPAAINALTDVLGSHATFDAYLHALIVYSTKTMSARPIRDRPSGLDGLNVAPCQSPEVAAPNYSPKALQRSMPEYRMEKAMLLKNGCQEYVMRLGQGLAESSGTKS